MAKKPPETEVSADRLAYIATTIERVIDKTPTIDQGDIVNTIVNFEDLPPDIVPFINEEVLAILRERYQAKNWTNVRFISLPTAPRPYAIEVFQSQRGRR